MASLAALSACGGGGGSSAASPPPAAVAAPSPQVAQLSRDQLKAVAASIYSDVLRAAAVASAAGETYRASAQLYALGTQTFQCSSSSTGTFGIVVTDQATAGQFDAGDQVAVQYTQCDLSDAGIASVVDGTQTVTLSNAVGTPIAGTTWSAHMGVVWTDLRDAPKSAVLVNGMNGSIDFTLSETAAGASTVTAQTNTLTLTDYLKAGVVTSTASAVSQLAYQNFVISYASDATGATSSVQGRTVYSTPGDPTQSAITVTYTTSTPFRTNAAQQPVQGDIRASTSALRPMTLNGVTIGSVNLPVTAAFRWVVIDATTVRLDADENSDGVLESSVILSFSEIQ